MVSVSLRDSSRRKREGKKKKTKREGQSAKTESRCDLTSEENAAELRTAPHTRLRAAQVRSLPKRYIPQAENIGPATIPCYSWLGERRKEGSAGSRPWITAVEQTAVPELVPSQSGLRHYLTSHQQQLRNPRWGSLPARGSTGWLLFRDSCSKVTCDSEPRNTPANPVCPKRETGSSQRGHRPDIDSSLLRGHRIIPPSENLQSSHRNMSYYFAMLGTNDSPVYELEFGTFRQGGDGVAKVSKADTLSTLHSPNARIVSARNARAQPIHRALGPGCC